MEKIQALLDKFLNETKLWKLAAHDDPFVRRAVYKLLSVAIVKQRSSLNPSTLSANVLTSGLHVNQTSSALDFAKAIASLSSEFPDVWTIHYTGSGRKSAWNRLSHFLKKGSQGGPPEFWSHISSLLSSLPPVLLTYAEEDKGTDERDNESLSLPSLLLALRSGINSKDEARGNQLNAWNTYLDASELVLAALPESTNRQRFYPNSIFPMITQYVRPSSEQSCWTISGMRKKSILLRVCNLVSSDNPKIFEDEFQALSAQITEDLKTSLPEQSKEYTKSQDLLSAEIERWYELQCSLLGEKSSAAYRSIMRQTVPTEVSNALAMIKSRNGKPYSAAAAVEKATRWIPDIVLGDTSVKKLLVDFANTVIPDLLQSPSAKHLIQLLGILAEKEDVSQGYERCMRTLLEMPESEARSNALQSFVSSQQLGRNESLLKMVMTNLDSALLNDSNESWKPVMAAFNNPAASNSLTDDMLVHMINNLSIDAANPAGLHGLEMAAKQREGIVKDFALSTKGSSLFQVLLSLSQSGDETISERARGLSNLVERAMLADGDSGQISGSMLEMINGNIVSIGEDSLGCVISLERPSIPADQDIEWISLLARRRNCSSMPRPMRRET